MLTDSTISLSCTTQFKHRLLLIELWFLLKPLHITGDIKQVPEKSQFAVCKYLGSQRDEMQEKALFLHNGLTTIFIVIL